MKFFFFFSLFFLVSCKNEVNNSGLNDIIYYELIKYQKENPIDKLTEKLLGEKHFIYQISILPAGYANSEDKNITVYITCSPFGIGKEIKKNYFGVYEDDKVKRTYIIDEANSITTFAKLSKKNNLEKYIVKCPPIIDIIFPVKMFNFRNNKLKYLEEISGN